MPRPSRMCCYEVSVIIAMLTAGLNIGLSLGLLGPTLPDLAIQTGVSLTRASTLATWRAVTYILGSMVAGVLLEIVDGFLGLSVVLLLQAVTTALSGWFSSFTLITFFQATSNFFTTIMVSGVPFLVFRLERSKARMVAQAAFLLFNVGKTLVPLIVAPFLSPDNRGNTTNTVTTMSISPLNSSIATSSWGLEHLATAEPVTQVGWAYVIVGGFCFLMFILYASITMANGCQWRAKSLSEPENAPVTEVTVETEDAIGSGDSEENSACINRCSPVETSDESGAPECSKVQDTYGAFACRTPVVIFTFMLCIFMQTGMEMVDNTLLLSFVIKYLKYPKTIGLVLTSLYQGVKVVVCIGIMFVVNRVHPSIILLTDIICMVLACSGMSTAVLVNDEVMFFIAISLLAIGMSNYYATVLSWLEGYYPITGRLSSLISVFFGVSGMALPPLATAMLAIYGAIAFPAILMISSVMCLILWGVLKVILRERICLPLNLSSVTPHKETNEKTPLLIESE